MLIHCKIMVISKCVKTSLLINPKTPMPPKSTSPTPIANNDLTTTPNKQKSPTTTPACIPMHAIPLFHGKRKENQENHHETRAQQCLPLALHSPRSFASANTATSHEPLTPHMPDSYYLSAFKQR